MNEDDNPKELPFVVQPYFLDQVLKLKSKEVKCELLLAIFKYGIRGEIPDFSDIDPYGYLDAIFEPIKQDIDQAKEKYLKKMLANKGGAPKGSRNNPSGRAGKKRTNQELTETNQELTETNLTNQTNNNNIYRDRDIDRDIDRDNNISKFSKENFDREREEREQQFSPPSLTDVKNYILENGLTINAEKFYYHYQGRCWKVNGSQIVDWRAQAHLWESTERNFSKKEEQPKSPLEDFINERLGNTNKGPLDDYIAKRLSDTEPQTPTPTKESEDLPF